MNKTLIGLLLMGGASLFYGTANTFLKKAGYNPIASITIQVAVLVLTMLPFFIATQSVGKILENKTGLLIVIALGIGNAIGFYLVVKAFDYLAQWQISMFTLTYPFLTAVAAYFVLHEPINPKLFAGMAFVAIGMVIAFR